MDQSRKDAPQPGVGLGEPASAFDDERLGGVKGRLISLPRRNVVDADFGDGACVGEMLARRRELQGGVPS